MWRSEHSLWASALSFHHVGSRDQQAWQTSVCLSRNLQHGYCTCAAHPCNLPVTGASSMAPNTATLIQAHTCTSPPQKPTSPLAAPHQWNTEWQEVGYSTIQSTRGLLLYNLVYKRSVTLQSSLQVSVTLQPSLQVSVTLQPSPKVSVTLQSSPQVSVTLQPSLQVSVTLQPSPQVSVTLQPSLQVSVTLQLSLQESVTLQPSLQVSVTLQPSLQVSVTLQPSPQESVTLQPSLQVSVTLFHYKRDEVRRAHRQRAP